MMPTVMPGDYFVGLVGLWGHRSPERFDMLIFDVPPNSHWAESGIPWMKRLVGMPGEHVRVSNGALFIDGKKIEASVLHTESVLNQAPRDFELQLRKDEYCVLGDDLDRSFDDSRKFGAVSRSQVKGRAVFVLNRTKAKRPNKAPEPTPVSVTPRATEGKLK